LGDKAPPKLIPKTLENTREFDETTVDINDNEIKEDEATDEFAEYFKGNQNPKVFITTNFKGAPKTRDFCKNFCQAFPSAEYHPRFQTTVKDLIAEGIKRNYTDMIFVTDFKKKITGMMIIHLPNGPTATFSCDDVRLSKDIEDSGTPAKVKPEIILNNFNTRLGHTIGRMFASLFPPQPNFKGRQVATFHNQRDFIFFRYHRYIFESKDSVRMQELGPQFTLKLKTLQKGLFNPEQGEYEWISKPDLLSSKNKRKFFL